MLHRKKMYCWTIIAVLLYIASWIAVSAWLFLIFCFLIIIPPIWHLIIHFKFLTKGKHHIEANRKLLYLSHITLIILALFQYDTGDGQYYVFWGECVNFVKTDFRSLLNDTVTSDMWAMLQVILYVCYTTIISLVTFRYSKISKAKS